MNPTRKKFISLFLIFSLVMLSANLYAKERRGAKLIITKKDGQLIEGELITVKPKSLLLLNTEGKDVSVDIEEIKIIKIVKKSNAGKRALYGLLIGGISGILLVPAFKVLAGEDFILDSLIENIEEVTSSFTIAYALIGGAVGLLIGGIAGAIAGIDKTIQIEGMTDLEIRKALDKLRKKARIRDYK